MNFAIFKSLKNTGGMLVFFIVAGILFTAQYYLMVNLPGSRNLQCVPGANMTPINIVFSIVLSLLTGLLAAAFRDLYKMRKINAVASGTSGLGLILGTLTVFCTACTLPVISLFGISVSLLFFTENEIALKGVSIFLMLISLWIVNDQLADNCKICKT